MRSVVIVFALVIMQGGIMKAQDKENYTAKSVITVVLKQGGGPVLSNIPIGKNVTLSFDKFFKVWIIRYEDKDEIMQALKFMYVRTNSNGDYVMKDVYENLFLVMNRIEVGKNIYIAFMNDKDDELDFATSIEGITLKK